jgi:hypothetical protein
LGERRKTKEKEKQNGLGGEGRRVPSAIQALLAVLHRIFEAVRYN